MCTEHGFHLLQDCRPATSSAAGTSDGQTALALAGLGRAAIASLGGRSLHDYYTEAAGGIGVASRFAGDDFVAQRVLADQADARRSSVQGVSVDEEMIALIAEQQAYGAAARLVSIADEMVQTLLQML